MRHRIHSFENRPIFKYRLGTSQIRYSFKNFTRYVNHGKEKDKDVSLCKFANPQILDELQLFTTKKAIGPTLIQCRMPLFRLKTGFICCSMVAQLFTNNITPVSTIFNRKSPSTFVKSNEFSTILCHTNSTSKF